MNNLRAPVAMAVLATLSLAGCSRGLTEASARSFVDGVEATAKACDADAFAKFAAPDMMHTSSAIAQLHMPRQQLDHDQTIGNMRTYCTSKAQVSYDSKVESVQVRPDGQGATVKLEVHSTTAQQGHKMAQVGEQVYTLALRDGEPKLVAVDATLKKLSIDGAPVF